MSRITLKSDEFDAVIFDMDGTMVDNDAFHIRSWIEFLKRYGISLTIEEFRKNVFGGHNHRIMPRFFGNISPERIHELSHEKEALYRELYDKEITEVAGLSDCIRTLKERGKKLAVASSAPRENRTFTLEKLHLTDTFDAVIGGEEIEHPKPAPDIFLETARRLTVSPERCIVFEDSPVGVEAALKAGMKVIGVTTTVSADELSGALGHVTSFNEIEIT